ncbi:hypothetical protein [Silvanigrella sp.]|jgi:hypothetical protein|uniref:hypothetical protein n=1 Tax=Silvanigrella sp. TaxID=2024976 RepID=UPI0037C600EE
MDELKELIDNYKIEKIFDYINNDLLSLKEIEKPSVIIYFFDKNFYKKYANESEVYLNFSKLKTECFLDRESKTFITNNHFDINGIIFKDNNDKIIISCLKNGLLKIQFNYGNEKSEEIIDEIINLYSKNDVREYYNKINFSYNIIGIKINETVHSKNSLGEEKRFKCSSIQENRFDVKLGYNSTNRDTSNQFNDYLINELRTILNNLKNYTNS